MGKVMEKGYLTLNTVLYATEDNLQKGSIKAMVFFNAKDIFMMEVFKKVKKMAAAL
jgi:hypothetical protein